MNQIQPLLCHGEFHIVSGARHMMSMTHKGDVLDRCLSFLLEQASS